METILINADEIVSTPVTWLWPQRIPAGTITILDGDPGVGKSLITARLAADITLGRSNELAPLDCQTPRNVLFVSSEDDLKRQFKPRLDAAGADCRGVKFFQGMRDDFDRFRLPSFPNDVPRLANMIRKYKPALVVIDPITAYLDVNINPNNDCLLRKAVMPFQEVVEETGCALLIVRHLNKSGGARALYRGAGTIGLVGLARSVLLAARHPEEPETMVLGHVKSNFDRPAQTLEYAIEAATGQAPSIRWLGTSEITADQMLIVKPAKLPREHCAEFLESFKARAVPWTKFRPWPRPRGFPKGPCLA